MDIWDEAVFSVVILNKTGRKDVDVEGESIIVVETWQS